MGWLQKIIDTILPADCLVCRDIADTRDNLCETCRTDLPWLSIACQQCSIPLSTSLSTRCGTCIKTPPAFDKAVASCHYQTPLLELIHQLKFHAQLAAAACLGHLLVTRVAQAYEDDCLPESILPVPLHPKRCRERGFNQAVEISRILQKKLNIPMHVNALQRVQHTPAQRGLSAKSRRRNLKNAFAVQGDLNAKHVVIVDDVMTTGSTMNQLAQLLKQHGVERVDVWCCARA